MNHWVTPYHLMSALLAYAPEATAFAQGDDTWLAGLGFGIAGLFGLGGFIAVAHARRSASIDRGRAKTARQQITATLENAPHVAVQWYDADGRILYWNSASERLYGWTAGDALGKRQHPADVVTDQPLGLRIAHPPGQIGSGVSRSWLRVHRSGSVLARGRFGHPGGIGMDPAPSRARVDERSNILAWCNLARVVSIYAECRPKV